MTPEVLQLLVLELRAVREAIDNLRLSIPQGSDQAVLIRQSQMKAAAAKRSDEAQERFFILSPDGD